jgi:periplasmic divalent cation tolerance protein
MTMEKFVQVFTTLKTEEDAELVAKALVKKKLSGYVQISRITSIYRREGQIEMVEEWRLGIKTREALFSDVKALISATTSQVASELIITPLLGGSEEYLSWLDREIVKK